MASSVVIITVIVFYCLSSLLRGDENQWQALPAAWQPTATHWRGWRWLSVIALSPSTHTHTHSQAHPHVYSHTVHTRSSHHWLLRREIAIGVRQGFNWSWSQFNVRQGLAVIGGREEGEGRVWGGDITVPDVKTRRPWWQEFCDVTHKDVRVLLGKCLWKSGQWRDGRHQAELNPNFPVTFWARSWLFLALRG